MVSKQDYEIYLSPQFQPSIQILDLPKPPTKMKTLNLIHPLSSIPSSAASTVAFLFDSIATLSFRCSHCLELLPEPPEPKLSTTTTALVGAAEASRSLSRNYVMLATAQMCLPPVEPLVGLQDLISLSYSPRCSPLLLFCPILFD